MDAASAFTLLNAAVLPWWALWLAAPRSRWARRAASHGAVFAGLSAVYAGLLIAALASGEISGLGYPSLRAGLATPAGFLAGWTHYLAFDLFVGAWMVRESNRLDVGVRPFLLFTLLAGPIGLGGFLARRAWRLRAWGGLGETDLA